MKHTEIPHILDEKKMSLYTDSEERILMPGDKIVYASIRRYMNEETRSCYPSIAKIKEKAKCGQAKIKDAITRLEKAGLIKVKWFLTPNGKKTHLYVFPKSEFDAKFEMFTDEFLDLDIPTNIKEYYMDIQKYMYDKDSNDHTGKIYYSDSKLASLIGISALSVKKYNKILREKGLLKEETTSSTDDAGLPIIMKSFDLSGFKQAELWVKTVSTKIVQHEDRIQECSESIEDLRIQFEKIKNENKEYRSIIDKFIKSNNIDTDKWVMS